MDGSATCVGIDGELVKFIGAIMWVPKAVWAKNSEAQSNQDPGIVIAQIKVGLLGLMVAV